MRKEVAPCEPLVRPARSSHRRRLLVVVIVAVGFVVAMKLYREWEANRKVFLSPEDWLEPDLRDDRSGLFSELCRELG